MRSHIVALTLTLTACDSEKDTGSLDCTAIYAASVSLLVTDDSGAPISDYTASYRVDGGEPEPCADGVCGYETAGTFSIVVDAVGYAESTVEVEVEADACHALTESVTITLEAVDCTQEAVPSLLVTLLDASDQPVDGATITYASGDASGECSSGEDALSNVFVCGEEIIGDIDIAVSAEGFADHTETVTVSGDEEACHPITEERTIRLRPDAG